MSHEPEDFEEPLVDPERAPTIPVTVDPVLVEIAKLGAQVNELIRLHRDANAVARDNNRILTEMWNWRRTTMETLEDHEQRLKEIDLARHGVDAE